jgi:hypothetical protein
MRSARSAVLALVVAAAAMAPTALATRDADASVSIAVTWDSLVQASSFAAMVTPTSSTSVWEEGRIYTYTQAHVDRAIAGDAAGAEDVWVRTMGGIVGNLGQVVDGEAVLSMGRPSLLFLHPGPTGALQVTARGQGQFPLVLDAKSVLRLSRSSSVGGLVQPKRSPTAAPPVLASEMVHGRLVDDVARDVVAAWPKAHAK